MREMANKEVKLLAFDVACGFFTDDQLITRFGLSLRQLNSIRDQRAFKKEVLETNRLLADDGSEFIIRAKEYAMDCLESLHDIAKDSTSSENAVIKASGMIFTMAKLLHLPSKDGNVQIGSMIINTNLALNDMPQGSYSIEAKPIGGELKSVPQSLGELIEHDPQPENADLI